MIVRTFAISLALCALGAAVFFYAPNPVTSTDWAAWAQALGGVLAVVAALVVAGIEGHRAKSGEAKRISEARWKAGRTALLLARTVFSALDFAVGLSRERDWTTIRIRGLRIRLQSTLSSVETFATSEALAKEDLDAMIDIHTTAASALGFLEGIDHVREVGGDTSFPSLFDELLDDSRRLRDHFESRYGKDLQ